MIRNIWAVGRNYADHAKELGNAVPNAPLIFLKAGSTATEGVTEIHLPASGATIHHEIELALRFDERLEIRHAAVALDLTDREKQADLKSRGEPWTLAKSFPESCPLSDFFPVASIDDLANVGIELRINGIVKQSARSSEMIFSLEGLVAYVKRHFPVCPGDLLLTGTPAGVGPLRKGDELVATIADKIQHKWTVRGPKS